MTDGLKRTIPIGGQTEMRREDVLMAGPIVIVPPIRSSMMGDEKTEIMVTLAGVQKMAKLLGYQLVHDQGAG